MRTAITAAVAALCVGTTLAFSLPQASFAAPGAKLAGAKQAGGKRMQKMADTLGLTDAQKAQMKPIMMSTRAQVMAIQQNTTLSPADRMAKMKAVRQSMRAQIMPILTADQKTKMAAMRHQKAK